MAFMEQLANGLRLAGGTGSPEVFKQIGGEEDIKLRWNQLMQQQAMEQARQDQRERALAQAVMPHLQSGNFDQAAAAAASTPGGFKSGMDLLGQAENRRARLQQAQDAIAARSQQAEFERQRRMEEMVYRGASAAELQAARLASDRQRDRERAADRESLIRLTASLRSGIQGPAPQMVTTPEGIFQIDRAGNTTRVLDPEGNPLTGKRVNEKALPVSAAQKLMENQQNLRRAEQALALISGGSVGEVKGDKEATGWKGFVPNVMLQYADPSGVDTRAAIADLGSLVVHDRSGAAVTASEFPRLRPFIPSATDTPEAAKKKLSRFVSEYQKVVEETTDFYRESGYNVPSETLKPSGANSAPSVDDLVKKYAK